MINKNELLYKIETIIEYLKKQNGNSYKLYNHTCPDNSEPNSNIVEYAEDVKEMCISILNSKENDLELPF